MRKISNRLLLLAAFLPMAVTAVPNGVVMTKTGGQGDHQVFYCNANFPAAQVKQAYKNSYHIVTVDFVNNEWCVVMNRHMNWGYQSYTIAGNLPINFIDDGLKDGLTITSIAASPGQIAIVMTQNSHWKQGSYTLYTAPWMIGAGPRGDSGKEYLVDFARIPDNGFNTPHWIAAYGTNATLTAQNKSDRTRFPHVHIHNQWNSGYMVDLLYFHYDRWWTVSSRRNTATSQYIHDYSSDVVNQKWQEGFYITDLY